MVDRKQPLRVRDVMSREVLRVAEQESVRSAVHKMMINHVSALPVIRGERQCVGIVTATDVIRSLQSAFDRRANYSGGGDSVLEALAICGDSLSRVESLRVSEIMSTGLCALSETTDLGAAARVMAAEAVHRAPVVDDEGHLVGILTTMDLTRVLGKWSEHAQDETAQNA